MSHYRTHCNFHMSLYRKHCNFHMSLLWHVCRQINKTWIMFVIKFEYLCDKHHIFFLVSVFVILLSVICYGLIFFPIFASLTLRSTIGYLLGSLHCWVLLFKGYNDTFGCHSYVSRVRKYNTILSSFIR